MTRIRTRTTTEVNIPDTDIWFVADAPLPDGVSDIYVRPVCDDPGGESCFDVSWIAYDPYGTDYDWQPGVEFEEFRTEWDRDDFIAEKVAEHGEDRVIIVDRYEHGLVHYSPRLSRFYPDRQWDVAPAAVLVMPDDVPADKITEYATAMLDEYSSWCNGDVWCVVVHRVNIDGVVLAADACGGFIGMEYAEKVAEEFNI